MATAGARIGSAEVTAGAGGRRSFLPLLVAACLMLAFFIWAGSGRDPRFILPWDFDEDGWLFPARGLTMVLAGAVGLFGLLSMLAYRLFTEKSSTSHWVSALLILDVAVLVRLVIAITWTPMPADAGMMGAVAGVPHMWRWLGAVADMGIVALLLYWLRRENRSPWLAGLYAFHPLPLLVMGSVHPVMPVILLPVLAIVLFFPKGKWVYVGAAAVGSVVAIGLLCREAAFNSFLAEFLGMLTPHGAALLMTLHVVAVGMLVLIGWRFQWSTLRILGHMGVLFLLMTPVLTPMMALPVLAVIPLAWVRAGWMAAFLSLTAMLALPTFAVTGHWVVPMVVLALAWLPTAVVEGQELLEQFAPGLPALLVSEPGGQ